MIIQRNFTKRATDINETFTLIDFIVNIESHKNLPITHIDSKKILYVSQEMQCAIKAQFLMLLYNIVESTVCDCLNAIYDSIGDEELTFSELSDEMKNMYRNNLRRTSNPNYKKTDAELMALPVRFAGLAVNISGSLDMRRIIEVFSEHGCHLNQTKREKYANSFLVVKNKRNNLAHGNISFSECGSNYLISDLQKFKSDILCCMQEVVTQTRDYISQRLYNNASIV